MSPTAPPSCSPRQQDLRQPHRPPETTPASSIRQPATAARAPPSPVARATGSNELPLRSPSLPLYPRHPRSPQQPRRPPSASPPQPRELPPRPWPAPPAPSRSPSGRPHCRCSAGIQQPRNTPAVRSPTPQALRQALWRASCTLRNDDREIARRNARSEDATATFRRPHRPLQPPLPVQPPSSVVTLRAVAQPSARRLALPTSASQRSIRRPAQQGQQSSTTTSAGRGLSGSGPESDGVALKRQHGHGAGPSAPRSRGLRRTAARPRPTPTTTPERANNGVDKSVAPERFIEEHPGTPASSSKPKCPTLGECS